MKVLVSTSAYLRSQNDPNYKYDFITQFCNSLKAHGDTVVVLAPRDNQEPKSEIIDGIKILRFSQSPGNLFNIAYGDGILPNIKKKKFKILGIPFFILSQIVSTIKVIIREKPDVFHAHWMVTQGLSAVVSRTFLLWNKVPVVITVHGSDYWGIGQLIGKRTYKLFLKMFYSGAEEIVAVSSSLQSQLSSDFKRPVFRGPMGVDTERFKFVQKDFKDGVRIVFLGTLAEHKSPKTLIQAIALIEPKIAGLKVSVVGHGPQQKELSDLVISLNLGHHVEFLGFRSHEELPQIFEGHQFIVAPSISEGLGLGVVEAMSCGLIPIASSIPAFDDTVIEQQTGFRFEVNNPSDLARVILKNCKNPELLNISKNASQHAAKNYSWKSVTNNYQNIYQKVLSRFST